MIVAGLIAFVIVLLAVAFTIRIVDQLRPWYYAPTSRRIRRAQRRQRADLRSVLAKGRR